MLSEETLRFLRDLVGQQQLSAANPDLMPLAALITRVRTELDEALVERTTQ